MSKSLSISGSTPCKIIVFRKVITQSWLMIILQMQCGIACLWVMAYDYFTDAMWHCLPATHLSHDMSPPLALQCCYYSERGQGKQTNTGELNFFCFQATEPFQKCFLCTNFSKVNIFSLDEAWMPGPKNKKCARKNAWGITMICQLIIKKGGRA